MKKLATCVSTEKAWYLIKVLDAHVKDWRPTYPKFWVVLQKEDGYCEVWTSKNSPIRKSEEKELKKVIENAIQEWRMK